MCVSEEERRTKEQSILSAWADRSAGWLPPTFDGEGVHINGRPIECSTLYSLQWEHVDEADLLKANRMKEVVVELGDVLVGEDKLLVQRAHVEGCWPAVSGECSRRRHAVTDCLEDVTHTVGHRLGAQQPFIVQALAGVENAIGGAHDADRRGVRRGGLGDGHHQAQQTARRQCQLLP